MWGEEGDKSLCSSPSLGRIRCYSSTHSWAMPCPICPHAQQVLAVSPSPSAQKQPGGCSSPSAPGKCTQRQFQVLHCTLAAFAVSRPYLCTPCMICSLLVISEKSLRAGVPNSWDLPCNSGFPHGLEQHPFATVELKWTMQDAAQELQMPDRDSTAERISMC